MSQTVEPPREKTHTFQDSIKALRNHVGSRVSQWQGAYIRRESEALAALARLRRGVGKEVGAMPDLWQYTLADLPVPEPDRRRPDYDKPTVFERAAYTAMTLFAVHQQSRSQGMHQQGQSLGTAVRNLRIRSASAEAVRRRFEALGTAETYTEVVNHARGLITQLRSEGIPLDYGALTEDFVWLQSRAADRVRLRWGRDFYRTTRNEDQQANDDVAANTAS